MVMCTLILNKFRIKSIKRIKIAGDTVFIIKNKRIELKSIDYFI